jgi:hypothetical protein
VGHEQQQQLRATTIQFSNGKTQAINEITSREEFDEMNELMSTITF